MYPRDTAHYTAHLIGEEIKEVMEKLEDFPEIQEELQRIYDRANWLKDFVRTM